MRQDHKLNYLINQLCSLIEKHNYVEDITPAIKIEGY